MRRVAAVLPALLMLIVAGSLHAQLVPPIITIHPGSQTAALGADVVFSTTVTNTASLPLTNRFRRGPTYLVTNVFQERSFSYALHDVRTNDAGAYTMNLLNAGGIRRSSNAVLSIYFPIMSNSMVLLSESCVPANGAIDPGEMVTVELGLLNTNAPTVSNLVATLEPGGGVLALSGSQTYEGLLYGGPSATRQFIFATDAACGSNITATLRLWDGSNDLGRVRFGFRVGPASGDCCYDTGAADLALTMTGAMLSAQAGSAVEYHLTVTNHGPGTASGIRVVNPSRPGLQLTGASSPSGVCIVQETGVVCDLADLPRAAGTVVTLLANLAGPPGVSITNLASVSALQRDDKAANNAATVVMTPPVISVPPQSQTVPVLSNATFLVVASGPGPFAYQWQKSGTNVIDDSRIQGAQAAALTLASVFPSDGGGYSVVVENAVGAVSSAEAVMTVLPLTVQPQSQIVPALSNVTFSVVAQGVGLTYQWQRCGTNLTSGGPISGAQTSTLTVSNVLPADAGNYSVIVGNAFGTVLSSDASLMVVPLVAWGDNSYGQTTIPLTLTNVVAVASGVYHNLGLKADGTIVTWGGNSSGQTNVPPGLSNVTAVAAGNYHSLALQSNGKVVAWGANFYGQTNVPTGLTNAAAIAAGANHCLTLRSNGTVVAWGYNAYGQANVPSGLSNVLAIAAGGAVVWP